MLNLNKVTIAGNLTRDPEVRMLSGNNNSVANFGLAINHKYKTKDGEKKEDTTFIDVEAWGRTAELVGQYMTKGSPVYIEGRLKLDQWEDKDGQKRSKIKVVADSVQFLSSKKDGQSAEPKQETAKQSAQMSAYSARAEDEANTPPF